MLRIAFVAFGAATADALLIQSDLSSCLEGTTHVEGFDPVEAMNSIFAQLDDPENLADTEHAYELMQTEVDNVMQQLVLMQMEAESLGDSYGNSRAGSQGRTLDGDKTKITVQMDTVADKLAAAAEKG